MGGVEEFNDAWSDFMKHPAAVGYMKDSYIPSFTEQYMSEVAKIAALINTQTIEDIVDLLAGTWFHDGRVFVIGIGGSAGNASHMVCDLRKLCGLRSYSFDNMSELTARTNDQGFENIFTDWLKVEDVTADDVVIVLSVGGGSVERNISRCLIDALKSIPEQTKTVAIVGKSDGFAAQHCNHVVVVPNVNNERVTPHSEAFQTVVWHCIVSHPKLQQNKTVW